MKDEDHHPQLEVIEDQTAAELREAREESTRERTRATARVTVQLSLLMGALAALTAVAVVLMVVLRDNPDVQRFTPVLLNLLTVVGFAATILIWLSDQTRAHQREADEQLKEDAYERRRQEAEEDLRRSIQGLTDALAGTHSKDQQTIREQLTAAQGLVEQALLIVRQTTEPGEAEDVGRDLDQRVLGWLRELKTTPNPARTVEEIARRLDGEAEDVREALGRLKSHGAREKQMGCWEAE